MDVFYHILQKAIESPFVADINRFAPGMYKNSFTRIVDSAGTEHVVEGIMWDDEHIRFYRQREGCFHVDPIFEYKFTWNRLEKLAESNEDIEIDKLRIPKDEIKYLFMLKSLDFDKLRKEWNKYSGQFLEEWRKTKDAKKIDMKKYPTIKQLIEQF